MRALKVLKISAIGVFLLTLEWSSDLRWLALGLCGFIWFVVFARERVALSRRRELAAIIVTASFAFFLGFRVEWIRGFGGEYWTLGLWSLPVTILWITLIARSLRFVYDQGSGHLVLKVAWLVCASFFAIGLLQSQFLPLAAGLACLLLAGLSLALWKRITVSATVAQGIGILLALLTISGVLKNSATLALLAPVFILGLPPLTFHPALRLIHAPAKRRLTTHQLFAIYASLSALSIVAVTWDQRPEWLLWTLSLSVAALSLPLFGLLSGTLSGAWASNFSHIRLLGVSFSRASLADAVSSVERFVQSKTPHLIVTPDTTALVKAWQDPALQTCYAQADLVVADGTGIVWASRWLGSALPERVAGIDLMQSLCQKAAARGYRVFLLGARPGVAQAAALRLAQAYPGLRVVGAHHGYFDDERALVQHIRAVKPDLLFVGMGVPRQELWLLRHRDVLGVPAMMGVGGSFDVLSGRLPRAPSWVQQAGLEWLYRLCLDPQRLGRTLLIPLFLCMVLGIKYAFWVHNPLGSTTSASSS